MLVAMLSKGRCSSFANHNKVVGSKVMVVGSSLVVIAGVVLVVNMCNLKIISLLFAIFRFLRHHLLFLHNLHRLPL